jgi:ATP-dependent helicase/nuclease subunit A
VNPSIDAAARESAIASLGSVLVQAPAGSGKTTLLAQRYLRLLASVDAPERILALTFTRLAAQEMRQRVLEALGAAGRCECPANMNARTWALAVAAKRHLLALDLEIESQPSRLRIETIDAFNAWLANQLPIAAGAGSSLRVLTDPQPCYQDAARRALAYEANDPFGVAVDRVLALDDQRWRNLVKLIAEMLPSRDRWLPLLAGNLRAATAMDEAQLRDMRRHFDEDLQLLIARILRRAHEVLGPEILSVAAALLPGAAQRLGAAAPHMAAWLQDATPLRPDASNISRWRCLAKVVLTATNTVRKRVTVADGFPANSPDKPVMEDLLSELRRDPQAREVLMELRTLPDARYSDEQWSRVREVAQVLVLAAAQLDGVFREQGAVDFPAVSMAALRALGTDTTPTDLNLRLDYRLQHILVDEFQDTSTAQLELVRLLTAGWQRGDGRSVFCVGDPMQSIYGFREAEVRAFLELAEVGIGSVRFELQRLQSNFRSAQPLVEWINACFSRLMPAVDDRERGAIAFRPSRAAITRADSGEPAVRLQGFATREQEASAIAEMIALELQQHPHWHVAVLVRAKSHAREIAAGLRRRSIAFRAVDIEPLQDHVVVRDILMLARALLHFGDRIAWLALLRAPWAGVSLADLLIIARGKEIVWDALRDEALMRQLSEEGRARCGRVRRTLLAALQVRNDTSIARWVERAWLCLGGASCVAEEQDLELAHAAFSRLRDLEQRGMPDAAELPESFAKLFADSGIAAGVEIMTIHKAKGLEFDMVVLPALDRTVPRNRSQLLLTHQFARTGRDGMVMAARPPIGAEADHLFDFLRSQVRDAATLEAQRLLYVACTRAKWQLRLTATFEGRQDAEQGNDAVQELRKPRPGSLLAVLWPAAAQQFVLPDAAEVSPPSPTDGAPRGGPLWRLPLDWSPQIGALSLPAEAPQAARGARDETPIFDWAGETARRIGSLVHAELQSLDVARVDERAIRAREGHFRRWLGLHGVPADRLPQAAERVVNALLAVHRDPRGRWILGSGYRDDFREHALSGHWQGEIARVVFDRSFIDAGVRWVIDYKTSQHQGGAVEEFLDREVERYRPQLLRYAHLAQKMGPEPVRVALYFPLMQAWREWAPRGLQTVDKQMDLDI